MTPELILVINGDKEHCEILKYQTDLASAVRLVDAARSTKGLIPDAKAISEILAAALLQVETLKPVPLDYIDAAALEPPEDIIEEIARQCHQTNLVYCAEMGDHSHLPWNETTQEIRNSAINGVKFMLKNLDTSPEELHANWMKDKIAAGYVLGPVKNIDLTQGPLTHPSLKPYDELPPKERFKDELFRFTIKKAIGKIAEGTQPPTPSKE